MVTSQPARSISNRMSYPLNCVSREFGARLRQLLVNQCLLPNSSFFHFCNLHVRPKLDRNATEPTKIRQIGLKSKKKQAPYYDTVPPIKRELPRTITRIKIIIINNIINSENQDFPLFHSENGGIPYTNPKRHIFPMKFLKGKASRCLSRETHRIAVDFASRGRPPSPLERQRDRALPKTLLSFSSFFCFFFEICLLFLSPLRILGE